MALLRRQRPGVAVLTALALLLTVLAYVHKGIPAAQLNLNDGGVWVTNQALKLVAHLNYPSRTLDGGVRTAAADVELSQHANVVLLRDTATGKAQNVDTADLTLGDGAALTAEFALSQGGTMAAVSNASTGKVWVLDAANVSSFSADADPTLDKVQGARSVVGADGVVHVVQPNGTVKMIVAGVVSDEGRIEGIVDLSTAVLTAVGDSVVVLDRAGSTVRTPKGTVPVTGADKLVPQLPGPAADRVLLAGADAYLWAPMSGGQPVVVGTDAGAGTPAAPAVLDSCGYLAWSGSGAYVRDCADKASNDRQVVDKLKSLTRIAFRVNRDVIVLNDLASGSVLLVNDHMRQVDNWQLIDNSTKKQDDKNVSSTETVDEFAAASKKGADNPPTAKDDTFGVRPGRTFSLPVLANDTDPDGDLLTASVKTQPTGATVSQVRGGEELSIAVPQGTAGTTYTFTYTADDGRGGRGDARVTVKVFPDSVNEAPVQNTPVASMTIGIKGEATYSLLTNFRDPEGDSMFLLGTDQPAGLSVKSRPDGVVTVKDLGTGGAGARDINVQVSDSRGKVGTGVLRVNVRDGKLPPIANTDHVTVLKDQQVTVPPLANDVDPHGAGLRLTAVQQAEAGQTIEPDYTGGSFRFKSTTPGVYYVSYQVANDSPTASTGYVRVDVSDPQQGKPVASDDLAMLPAGGSVIVDALANDTDPAGGVLVLKSVDVPASAPIAVEIVDHNLLRISAPVGLQAPIDFGYVVSNGPGEATGHVTVVPVPASATATPPIATADRAVVRLGDIVTVPVLDNDQSPSGLPLTIDPKATIEGDASAGDVFVARDVVRFRAKKAGTFRVNYTVRDSAQNYSTAQITITVTPLEAPNNPPLPQPIVGRVLAGSKVVIPVPTAGIDPDGDSVTLVGIGSAPTRGTAVVTADAIEYTAPADAVATDTFTYEVADRFGARASSSVRVGIAPPNTTNQSPVAVPDDVATRPGRTLGLKPVANDVDPDGDALSLISGSVVPADDKTTVPVTLDDDVVELKTPAEEGVLHYYYGVSDGRGGSAKGVITIRVSADAVLKPPVAVDDVVTSAQVKDVKSVTVDVLANDYDPDGTTKELKVSTTDAGASVADNKLVVTLTDQRQVVLYTVTDSDGNAARAAVIVPPADAAAPYLDTTKIPLQVQAGELLTVELGDVVIVRPGHKAQVTFAAKVKAGVGADGATETVKGPTTLQFRSAADFGGMSSITFEVTDGNAPDDPQGRVATLSLPIRVLPAPTAKHPPVFTPSDVTVAAGEAAKTVDLKAMVTDPDPGDLDRLAFTLGETTGGLTVALNGSTLSVSAPASMTPGTTGSAKVTVTDGSTPTVPGQLLLKVTASSRPLMSIKAATINDAKAGSPSTIDLSGYITNPFAAEGTPVTIAGTPSVAPAGASVAVDGLKLTITPPAGMHGQLVVTYAAQDATKSAARQVRGTVTVTVRDKPDPPTAVTAETHLSRTVTLAWTAGANNGAPIDSFTVRWSGGQKDCGAVTTCLIDSLTNDVAYTFTVTAHNVVGESTPSAPSPSVTPDVKPNPPGAPVGTFGDKQVALTWAAATTDGSPVTSYTVEVSPAVGGTTQQTVQGATSYTWAGLTNGTAYTFRIQAHNKAPNPSDWSASSRPVVPAGLPFPPAAPNVTKDPVSALAPAATVAWTAPNGNGDNNFTAYEVRNVGSGATVCSGAWATSCHIVMSVSTTDQTYQVHAKNKAGWGDWSAASNGVRGWQTPGAVTNLTVTPTGTSNQVTISFGAANGNGALAGEMTYFWTAGGVTQSIAAGGATVTSGAFANGQNVSVAVYAKGVVKGESSQGASTSTTVNAYGPPTSPSISCWGGDQAIGCSWSGGSDNGRSTSYVLSNAASGSVGASGSTTVGGIGYSATRTVCIQAQQSTGLAGAVNCASATSNPPPPSTLTKVSVNGLRVTFRVSNFGGAGVQEVRCWNAATWDLRKWGTSVTSPGNNLGGVGGVSIPSNGDVTITCPGNPYVPSMMPNADFSLEVLGYSWFHIGN